MSEYANLLRSPLWQQKRLDILNSKGFKCEECSHTEKELHVHHRHYEKGCKPWEYDDAVYVVLCSECHANRHDAEAELRKLVGLLNTRTLLDLRDFVRFVGPGNSSLFYLGYRLVSEVEVTAQLLACAPATVPRLGNELDARMTAKDGGKS